MMNDHTTTVGISSMPMLSLWPMSKGDRDPGTGLCHGLTAVLQRHDAWPSRPFDYPRGPPWANSRHQFQLGVWSPSDYDWPPRDHPASRAASMICLGFNCLLAVRIACAVRWAGGPQDPSRVPLCVFVGT